MSKLRQDWVDDFQSQEGESLKYITVTNTLNSTTGSITSQSTAESATFTALFEIVLQDEARSKQGDLAVGDAVAYIPKSFNAAMHDRIRNVTSNIVYEIEMIDQRKTHDSLVLVEYNR